MLFPPLLSVTQKDALLSQPDSFLTHCHYKDENYCCCPPSLVLFQPCHLLNAFSTPSVLALLLPYQYWRDNRQEGLKHRHRSQSAWALILAPLPRSYGTLGRLLKNSAPQFPLQENGDGSNRGLFSQDSTPASLFNSAISDWILRALV